MKRLEERFADSPGPRTVKATLHDPLETVTIALCATPCGAESRVDMALFGTVLPTVLVYELLAGLGVQRPCRLHGGRAVHCGTSAHGRPVPGPRGLTAAADRSG